MKYFTKDYVKNLQRSDISLLMRVSKKAEHFDEKYYKDLYKRELKKFLKDQKEVCEMDIDEVFDEDGWDEICQIDENGNFVNVEEFMSEEEVQQLREEILEEERIAKENYEKEEYDEEEFTKNFQEGHFYEIENLKENLPDEILKNIADIRVLALGKVSKHNKKKIEKYCKENEKAAEKTMKEYEKYFKNIKNKIPDEILENYDFHDCEILNIEKHNNDIVFNLDNSGGFTNINQIIYKDAKVIENNFEENSYWIYDEIYIIDGGYEFHIGIDGENGYDYITLQAKYVDFK